MNNLDDIRSRLTRGDKEGAIKMLVSSLRVNSDDIDAWLLLGEVIDDPAKKRDCYNQVLKLSPNNPLALSGLRKLEIFSTPSVTNSPNNLQNTLPKSQTTSEVNSVAENKRKKLTDYEASPESPKEAVSLQESRTSCVTYLILGIIILCLISSLGQCASDLQDLVSPASTASPQEQAAVDAVKNQHTSIANNMPESVAVVLVLLENEGHTQSVDGWYVSKGNGYYSVKFYFYLDGNREYAEWWYYPGTKSIIPKNNWAFTFMGN